MQIDIHSLIHRILAGECSQEEFKELSEDYDVWRKIDVESPKEAALSHYIRLRRNSRMRMLFRTVASIAAIVLVAVLLWPTSKMKHTVIAPELSQAVQKAIRQSEATSRHAATLLIKGVGAIDITTKAGQQQVAKLVSESSEEDAPAGTLLTNHRKDFWMTLDDGTKVHLNYNSSITYPLVFGEKERRVKVSGEAYFFVAHDANRPFIVETAQGETRDYGTEFDIKATESLTQVVLVKGSVGVSIKGGVERKLRPGMMATLQNGRAVRLAAVDTAPYVSWNTGTYSFDGASIGQVMGVIGKWYYLDVVFQNDSVRNMMVSGSLDRQESLEVTLQSMRMLTNREIRREKETVYIK